MAESMPPSVGDDLADIETEFTSSVEAAPETGAPSADDATDPAIARRNRLAINILLTSTFVVFLNETIMGVALPRLMEDLSIPASTAQWLTTAFMLTMAIVIPITGFLLQRFNTRPMFMTAMILFSIGTAIAAMAPGFSVLLVGRVVQATGTAIMMPLLMTTVMTLVSPSARGKTMGNISIVMSVAPAIGPLISGAILSVLDWRWMFWLVLPIAIGALVLGALRIPNVTTPRKAAIDPLSIVLSVFAFGGIVYGLSTIGTSGQEASVPGWIPLTVGAVGLLFFVLRQLVLQRTNRALLDLRTFLSRNFTLSIGMLAISMMALFGTIILLPIYTQNVLGLDTLTTGLLVLPGGLLMGLLGPVVGRLYDRLGPSPLVIPGSIVLAGVLWSMTLLTENTPFLFVLVAHMVMSVGLAFVFTPLFSAGLSSIKPELYSHGSAVVGTIQQLAAAAGTALFITVMTSRSLELATTGSNEIAATAGGVHSAFICGAIISLFAIVAAFFVRRPAEHGAGMPAGH